MGASLACATAAAAQPADPPPPEQRLNPSGRGILLTTPLKDGEVYLGDVLLRLETDDRMTLSGRVLVQLLAPRLKADLARQVEALAAGREFVAPADLAAVGIGLTFDPQRLELTLAIAAEQRAPAEMSVAPIAGGVPARVETPARVSGFLTARGALEYVHQREPSERTFTTSTVLLDGAVRVAPVVLESQATFQSQSVGPEFQRNGTRLIYDDVSRVMRWTLGDLRTTGRSFQTYPELAGISVLRVYSVLQPTRIAQPGGNRQFRLTAPATVEVLVNDRLARRERLEPGIYDLRDFPLTEGANDVSVVVQDATGRREVLRFNLFYDWSQLARGVSEFGLYAGVAAPLIDGTPRYTDQWAYTGWYRRGLTDTLTVGVNTQGAERYNLTGAEAVWATRFGTLTFEGAVSSSERAGEGGAVRVTFNRIADASGAFGAYAEARSERFILVGDDQLKGLFRSELGLAWSRSFGERLYAAADLRYRTRYAPNEDQEFYRLSAGYRLNRRASIDVDLDYTTETSFKGAAARVSLTVALGGRTSARAEYDSRFQRARAEVRAYGGEDVGEWNASGDVQVGPDFSALDALAAYTSNRGEFGGGQLAVWRGRYQELVASRTSLRAAGSIAFADGAWAIGRPIHDSFALFTPHRSLEGARVVVQPTERSYDAMSGRLGPALAADLSPYAPQSLSIATPEAPAAYDTGPGVFQVFPPYRSGYRLQVGSEYFMTAFGVLRDALGEPMPLVAGLATELAAPNREPLVVFTNRQGRFAASGLRPGRWRLEIEGDAPAVYMLDIPKTAEAIVLLGDLRPVEAAP